MTEEPPPADRIDRLEATVEKQAARIEELEERLESDGARVARRSVLGAAGALGALGLGTGVAAADPRGQVGTAEDPLRAVYTESLGGGLTGGESLTELAGTGLAVEDGSLSAAGAADNVDVSDAGTTVTTSAQRIDAGTRLAATGDGDVATVDHQSPGGVHVVAPEDGDFDSVQAALDAAADGDVIRVAPGTYEETLAWPSDATVHLVGAGRTATTVVSDGTDPVVDVAGDSEIRGVTVRNEKTRESSVDILRHDDDGSVLLRNVRVEYPNQQQVVCVRNLQGSLTVEESVVRTDSRQAGHAVWVEGGSAVVRRSVLDAGVQHATTLTGGELAVVLTQLVGQTDQNDFGNYDEDYNAR